MTKSVRRKLGPVTLDIPAVIIGVQILLKGWEKLADFGHHPFIVTVLLLLGSLVTFGAFVTLWLEKRLKSAHALFHVAEGVAISLSAVVLFEKGKLRLPLVLLLAGLCYIVAGIVESRPPARRAQLAGSMMRAFGWVFLAAGLALGASTAFHGRDVGALGAAAVITGVGVALLLLRPRLAPRTPEPADGEPAAETH
jgi:hypothetical protein